MALERAELAVISAVAFAEAASGRPARALAVLRAQATLAVFFPGAEANELQDAWNRRCRVGERGALYILQSIRLLREAWRGNASSPELPAALVPIVELADALGSGSVGG